ncbi:hypothetical protein F4824DRAFT_502721 [Ustulina deusta]|nr:hypothetical protein F4824DRAFT_502721 [Ustulina deusta]
MFDIIQELSVLPAPFAAGIFYQYLFFDSGSTASYAVTGPEGVTYSAEDDAAIEKWIRYNPTTGLGTCKMAPLEDMGMMDESLGVYGVRGLKAADSASSWRTSARIQ